MLPMETFWFDEQPSKGHHRLSWKGSDLYEVLDVLGLGTLFIRTSSSLQDQKGKLVPEGARFLLYGSVSQ